MLEFLHCNSERLYTRELKSSDCERLFEIYQNGEAMKYRGSKSMVSIKDAQRMVENQHENTPEFHKSRFAICLKSNHELIGTLLLIQDRNSNQMEVGFSFAPECWNKGYGSELLESVCETSTDNKLIAWCRKENLASVKLFQKAGFTIQSQTQYPNSLLMILSKGSHE